VLYPREYNIINVGGTVSVMEAMRDVGVKRVVLTSSGAVYGDQASQPLTETTPPDPHSPYAVSKLAAEHYVRTIGSLWGIETVSLRVFNAFGPHQPLPAAHPPVIPHFLRQASQGGTLVIHGQGEQTRDFVFINDALEALVAAATAPGIDRLVINIGSGHETSIKDLAQAVMETMNVKTDWMPKEDQDPGPSRMCADIQLARQKLGYQPHFDLREGLKRMIDEDDRFQPQAAR
jgi:UDP-glucose 4-epimerase